MPPVCVGSCNRVVQVAPPHPYRWVDYGSSYLPSEIVAAFLYAQLEAIDSIQASREATWNRYHDLFAQAEAEGLLRRPGDIPVVATANHKGASNPLRGSYHAHGGDSCGRGFRTHTALLQLFTP